MADKHYCPKCEAFVQVIRGEMRHPDIGATPCLVCIKCKSPVQLKDDRLEPA